MTPPTPTLDALRAKLVEPTATPPRCEDCLFWDTSAESGRAQPGTTAQCRRRAPQVDDRTGLALWPFTEDVDWCGDFVERAALKAACAKAMEEG